MQALARHFGIEEPDTDMPVRLTEDRHWQHAVLSHNDKKDARYLARQLSWRLTIEDYPAFVLSPRDPADFDDLVDCLERPKFPRREGGKGKKGSKPDFDHPLDLDVIIGVTGSQTPNGIEVKMDQVFQIAPNRLIPPGADYFQQLADNHGLTDEDRAYNYLIARYAIEPATLNAINRDFELAGVPALYSRLGGDNRRIVRVIYTFNSKGPDAPAQRKFFVRVDVTDEFPFMVTSWNRYLERGEQS